MNGATALVRRRIESRWGSVAFPVAGAVFYPSIRMRLHRQKTRAAGRLRWAKLPASLALFFAQSRQSSECGGLLGSGEKGRANQSSSVAT